MERNTSMSSAYLAEDNSAPLMNTCITFLVLETMFMILLYTSRFLSSEQKASHAMVLLMTSAYLVCISKITVGILSVQIGGGGRHIAALTPTEMTNALKLQTVLQIVCPMTTSLSKLSILCLFYSIFGQASRVYRNVIRATFILVLVVMIVQVIIPFTNCKPFSHTWNIMGKGSCAIDALALWRYMSIPNVVTTIIVVGIPLPALYRLNVSPATKLGLGFVFSVAVTGIVAAIMRFQSFLAVQNFHDITFEEIKPLSWTIAESGIYLIAGVMPTLRPLVRKICGDLKIDRIFSRKFGSSWASAGSRGSRRWSRRVMKVGKMTQGNETGQEECSDLNSKATTVMVTQDEEKGSISNSRQNSNMSR